MITPQQAYKKYGKPELELSMVIYEPKILPPTSVPSRIYCNRDLVQPLDRVFYELYRDGLLSDIITWDGCFNIRKQTGSLTKISLHSWGLAVDINANWNKRGKKPILSHSIVAAFTRNGFDWGGHFDIPDGMHFQLSKIPS